MRIHFVSALAGAATLWLLSAGCGDSGTGNVTDDRTPEEKQIDTFCDTILPSFCAAVFACCSDKYQRVEFLNAGTTAQLCVAYWKDSWCLNDSTKKSLLPSLKAGHTILDQAKLNDCVAQFKAMAAGGAACVTPPMYLMQYSCFGAFRGQIPPGEACDWEVENVSFMQCKDGRCEQGKCVPFLKTGEACPTDRFIKEPPDSLCNYVEGEWCRGAEVTGTCGPLGKEGEQCDDGGHYGYLACHSHRCADDQCAPMRQDFEACSLY